MKPLDLNTITPGVREVVRWLREHDFNTTDSGDGLTNVNAGMEGVLRFPHVHIKAFWGSSMLKRALRLHTLLEEQLRGRVLRDEERGPLAPDIQVIYSPIDGVATLSLINVNDLALAGTPLKRQMLHGYDKSSGQLVSACDWEDYGWMHTEFTRFEICPQVTGCRLCGSQEGSR